MPMVEVSNGGTHEIRIINDRYYSSGYVLRTRIYIDGVLYTTQVRSDVDGTQLDYTFTV